MKKHTLNGVELSNMQKGVKDQNTYHGRVLTCGTALLHLNHKDRKLRLDFLDEIIYFILLFWSETTLI